MLGRRSDVYSSRFPLSEEYDLALVMQRDRAALTPDFTRVEARC